MFATIIFDVIVVCFAMALICWSASEMLHIWQAGVLMSLIFLLGSLVLLVRLVVLAVQGTLLEENGIWAIFAFAFAVCTLYIHFRLFGTMVMPAASVILIALEMLIHLGYWPAFGFSDDVWRLSWMGGALVLAMVGLALTTSWLVLGACTLSRRGRLEAYERAEAECDSFEDEAAFRAHSLRVQFIGVTRKMPAMLSHFGWWALAMTILGLGGYVISCYTLYGRYWIYEPLFALLAFAWALLFIGKDMLFAGRK